MKGKVILFIFEGTSDEKALTPYINDLINECKLSLSVEIIGGDKTSAWIKIGGSLIREQYEWTSSNIRKKMIERINRHISSNRGLIPGLKQKDICNIYYVTDTDNCFQDIQRPERLNKSKCMKAIFGFNTLELAPKVEIPIELIFFAKELEHVTVNKESEFSPEEKDELAINFTEKVYSKEGFFEYTFIKNELKTWDSFSNSYLGITSHIGRACNMNNLLEKIATFRREKYEQLIEEIKEIELKLDSIKNLTSPKVQREKKTLENNIKFKNKEKNSLEKIIEKREKALDKYLENNI